MATKEGLCVLLDAELKHEAAKILAKSGLDFSGAITIYFKKIVEAQRIPFKISSSNYSSEEVMGKDWRKGLTDIEDDWE